MRETQPLKLGSLFDGVGMFPLAGQEHGIEPVWASEIEKAPITVTRRHFPKMKHLGDVTKIDGTKIEPVDVITFGSPCTDLSVAGKREGLAGERSGLFYEAVRIIREMREATDGRYPTFAVWENVVGAFSSNEGRDFAAVLTSLVGAEADVPTKGWTRAGIAFGPIGQAAWRTFDAQFWGVPQRRRRIILVADFTGQRAGQILFEPYGLPGDSPQSQEEGQGVAGSVEDGAGTGSRVYTVGLGSDPLWADDTAQPITCRNGDPGVVAFENRYDAVPKVAGTLMASGPGLSRPAGMASETDFLVPQVSVCPTTGTGRRMDAETETLIPVAAVDCRNFNETADLSGTLCAKENGSYSLNYQNPVRIGYTVRRLTPTECERLMDMPDGWTEWGIDENDNRVELSDTARYKACGNSVVRLVVSWVLGRTALAARGELA